MTRCIFHRWRNRASEKSNVCTEVCCLIRQESCIPKPDLRELTTHSLAHSALFPKENSRSLLSPTVPPT